MKSLSSYQAHLALMMPLTNMEGVDQYGSFSIPSYLVLYQSHPKGLVNQNEILIELSC